RADAMNRVPTGQSYFTMRFLQVNSSVTNVSDMISADAIHRVRANVIATAPPLKPMFILVFVFPN
ncbi:MAG: hypothetical protein ACI3YC_01565, partial [Alloprevotella sp.]